MTNKMELNIIVYIFSYYIRKNNIYLLKNHKDFRFKYDHT